MVHALYLGISGSLDQVGTLLNIDKKKLSTGKDLIRKFCVPRKPTKNNPNKWINPEDEPEAFLTVDGVQVATKEYNTTYHAAKVVDSSDENAVEVELKGESAYIVPGDVIDKNATFSEATYIFVKATPKTNTTYDATGADSKLVALTRIVPLASDAQYNVTKLTAKAVLTANATGKNHKSIGYTGKAIFFDKSSFGDVENDDDAKAAYAKRQADISLTYKKASIDVDKYFDVQYVNNIQQGTATVILSPKTVITEGDEEKANPYTGTRTFTFKIKKSAIQDTMKPAEADK